MTGILPQVRQYGNQMPCLTLSLRRSTAPAFCRAVPFASEHAAPLEESATRVLRRS